MMMSGTAIQDENLTQLSKVSKEKPLAKRNLIRYITMLFAK